MKISVLNTILYLINGIIHILVLSSIISKSDFTAAHGLFYIFSEIAYNPKLWCRRADTERRCICAERIAPFW